MLGSIPRLLNNSYERLLYDEANNVLIGAFLYVDNRVTGGHINHRNS
jgi:hypothetical protein